MYFKQVEMTGFKSFADPTRVNLEPGITAIVGPNGCGKSNILDALRWSLGEQSAKALRGSHMQDVIFNGSEHRPAGGMAEVSLTFDNADSKLPVDFAEVTITRRVYRSGESEYLLNKAGCRLRDIQELFMDTGIGTNAYSLIGQGKIDLVLSSKPDDRRYLFEEAAGIIKYKSRKRVAMRKLDSAEQNLVRLNDVITEVQRQMRSLKRQVNAAIRHRELTEALRELEIRNAWLQFNELSGQVTDLRERFHETSATYEKASAETARMEARAEELNLKRVELERVLMARREGEHQIESEMEKIEGQIALFKRDIEFAQQQRNQAEAEHKAYTERAETATKSQDEGAQMVAALAAELGNSREGQGKEQAAYQEAQAAVSRADAELEAVRARTLERINARNKTQTELETLGVNIANIDAQLEKIFEQQQTQQGRHGDLSGQLAEMQKTLTEKRDALAETEEKRRVEQTERTEAAQRQQTLNESWVKLREQKSSKSARLNSLRELRDRYEGFAHGVKAVMQKNRDGSTREGIIGPAGDLISTDTQYERAVEAALGGNINNIVVETADAAKSAIAMLREKRAGRVTFLPLDTLRPNDDDRGKALKGQPGIIGKVMDYIQFEPNLRPAIAYLMQDTIIVETIDDAIRIARAERRFPRMVTLDGEVMSPAGAVTGGRTQHESRGLLGRSAEIEELETTIKTLDVKLKATAEEADLLTAAIKARDEALQAMQALEAELRREINETDVKAARLSTEVESLNDSESRLTQQRDALRAERDTIEQRRDAAMERVNQLAGDDAAGDEETTAAQAAAQAAREHLAKCNEALGDLRVRVAELSQAHEEAERNRRREEAAREEALRETARRLEVAGQMETRTKDLESRIAEQLERSKALSETKEEAHDKVLEAQTEQHGVIEESDKLNTELKKLRVKSDAAQKEVHKLELDLTHKEDRINFFQERIMEEYGLQLGALSEKEVGTDEYDEKEREKLITENRKALQRLGTVNLMAIEEYETLEKRDEFLRTQEEDLRKARETLLDVVGKIDETILEMFMETFKQVAECFKNYFRRLFNGGQARIYLLDEDDPLESGIEIEARPPGKKPQVISLLSGGEQAMTAIALLFSIFSAKPSPFCVLDEVDAPLDDANIGRFLSLVDDFADASQFIIITHSKQTMAHAGALFGVTQQERGVSQLVAVKIEDVEKSGHAA